MHIPPYHKLKSWQFIIIGVVIGSLISYCVLIFMYGSMYEKLYGNNLALQSEHAQLVSQYEALIQDKRELDEKSKQPTTIDTVEVFITNQKELRLDRLITHQLEEMVKQEIIHIIGQDVAIVSESAQLLLSSIENKAFSIDDFTYYFEIKILTISRKVNITVETKIFN